MPPPRWVQKINAVLHSEPLASLVYGLYWSLVLILSFPLVLSVLWGRTIGRILVALLWPETATTYDPSRRSGSKHDDSEKQEWAVVITGCDTGFGRELALRAADKGYIVFAGCLHPSSWKDESATILTKGTIFPLPMDVTKDDQVQNAVAKVKAWLTDATTEQPTNPPKRILHAVINNAGVGLGGLVDWTEMSTFQYCLDGTCCTYFVWCQCSPFSPFTHRPRWNCSQLLGHDSSVQGLFALVSTTSRSKGACTGCHAHFECHEHGGSRGQWHVGPGRVRRLQARGQCLFDRVAHRAGGIWHCRHHDQSILSCHATRKGHGRAVDQSLEQPRRCQEEGIRTRCVYCSSVVTLAHGSI
jgi:short chain dehydrogenase